MNLDELKELDIHFIHPSTTVHHDYRPIKIHVYKNGEELDKGKDVAVTRREFKHWIIFLDGLTKKLNTSTAIHRLFTIHGIPVEHFDELEHKGEYVAVEKGNFIHCRYGRANNWSGERKWKSLGRVDLPKPVFLESAETMDIYLKREGYDSITGLPYPFDGILSRSPSTSALHLKSHHSHIRKFGSLEKLNQVGQTVWGFEDRKFSSKERVSSVPKLPPLGDILSERNSKTEENNNEKQRVDNEAIVPKPEKTVTVLPPIDAGKGHQEKQEKDETKGNKTMITKEKLPPIKTNAITKESRIPIKKFTKRELKTVSARPTWSQQKSYESKEYKSQEIVESIMPLSENIVHRPAKELIIKPDSPSLLKQSQSVPQLHTPREDYPVAPRPLITRREREQSERRRRRSQIQQSDNCIDTFSYLRYPVHYDPDFSDY